MDISSFQFEITIKEYSAIHEIIELLKKFNIKSIAITQKLKHINNIAVAKEFKNAIPDLDIMLNFSITHNYSQDYSEIENNLIKYINEGNGIGVFKFLIVSGAHRKLYSSIDAFNFLKFKDLKDSEFYCAYNPYLTNYILDEEDERLRYKIASKAVAGIYYQLGNDFIKMKRGIKVSKHIGKGKKFFGSLLFPNIYILNKLKATPWYGVKFSDSYLNNLNLALKDTKKILEIYKLNNIKPLIQIVPFNNQNLYNFSKFIETLKV